MKDMLLVSLDFKEARNVRLTPLTAVLLFLGYAVVAHCGLFWLAWLAAKPSICRVSGKVVTALQFSLDEGPDAVCRTTIMDLIDRVLFVYQIPSNCLRTLTYFCANFGSTNPLMNI